MVAAPIAREAGNHMNAYCVVTVDGIRARFFCLEKSEQTGIGASQFLVRDPRARTIPSATCRDASAGRMREAGAARRGRTCPGTAWMITAISTPTRCDGV